MSTVVASSTAPSLSTASHNRDISPKSFPTVHPPTPSVLAPKGLSSTSNPTVTPSSGGLGHLNAERVSPKGGADGKISPRANRSGLPPKIIVKREPPASPDLQTSRHRPHKLDLSKGLSSGAPLTSRPTGGPLTARESGGIAVMHDVGLACLSPGFSTQDPTMREQLQRSISVRDQQRHIIESRLQKTAKPGEGDSQKHQEMVNPMAGSKTPMTSRRKAPPGLSIVAPSHEQFANERVIQSAPLHRSFLGRHQPDNVTRHITNQPSNLSNTSHIHHVPATQTNNRLPPITDVFHQEGLGAHREGTTPGHRNGYYVTNSQSNSAHTNVRPPFPSPGQPASQGPTSASSNRPRDYRSAEEHMASMSGGREELLPKIIHYGGHQPPTPPSPTTGHGHTPQKTHNTSAGSEARSGPAGVAGTAAAGASRRRQRAEYERDLGSPPLGSGRGPRPGPFGEERDSPETSRKKKEEFLGLCARAWELFHS